MFYDSLALISKQVMAVRTKFRAVFSEYKRYRKEKKLIALEVKLITLRANEAQDNKKIKQGYKKLWTLR